MIDIQNINGYGIQDPGFELLRQAAQKYCPEELQEVRQSVLPDEALNLEELATGFKALLAGGSGYGELPYIGDEDASTSSLPKDDGFGIGGAMEDAAVQLMLCTQGTGVDQVAVVAQGQVSLHMADDDGLDVVVIFSAGGGITDMADRDIPFSQTIQG